MSFFKSFLEENKAVADALKIAEQKMAEHLQVYETTYEFTTKLSLHYSRTLEELFEEYRGVDKIPDHESALIKKISNARYMLREYPDSYAHSVKYIELSIQAIHEINLDAPKKTTLEDKLKIKESLEKMYRAAGYITDTEDVQHSYCVRMNKCIKFANDSELLTWDKEFEQVWREGIKKTMPATYEKAVELSQSVRELQKAVDESTILQIARNILNDRIAITTAISESSIPAHHIPALLSSANELSIKTDAVIKLIERVKLKPDGITITISLKTLIENTIKISSEPLIITKNFPYSLDLRWQFHHFKWFGNYTCRP